MEQSGIMLYGYTESDARLIRDALEAALGKTLLMLSGSRRESRILEDILSDETHDVYEEGEPRVLMFLGFDDEMVKTALSRFPGADRVARPIFCAPTEQNITWPLSELLEHLEEERNYWKNKEKK
jgi:hypothetical protein